MQSKTSPVLGQTGNGYTTIFQVGSCAVYCFAGHLSGGLTLMICMHACACACTPLQGST